MECFVDFIGLCAPGMTSWEEGRGVLRNEQPFKYAELPRINPQVLPPNERRRTTHLIKIALQVACEAIEQSGLDARQIPSVFASSLGDMEITDRICRALSMDERPVSPTQFHNSVHNAPAGYWSIATSAQQNSLSLSAHNASFAAGLLEAACLVNQEVEQALLVAYDVTAPEPLRKYTSVTESFAVAILLSRRGRTRTEIDLRTAEGHQGATPMHASELEKIRQVNPAARSLPLLACLANDKDGNVLLPYVDDQCLAVSVQHAG